MSTAFLVVQQRVLLLDRIIRREVDQGNSGFLLVILQRELFVFLSNGMEK